MRKHHVLAVTLAGINIFALLVDTVIVAATGQHSFIVDDSQGSNASVLAAGVALGVTFLVMGLVVMRESPRFANARRAARIGRPVLMVGVFFLGGGFLTVYPLQTLSGLDEDAAAIQVSGLVAFSALTAVFLAAFVIGLAVIGRNPLGIGGLILGLIGPVILLTVLLALVAPTMASPVYCTMVVLAGVSLIGVRANPIAQRERLAATASPTSPV
jgi:hypothetical protein